eukprot:scaffold38104_cov27-Prasinocladus_malaysianus.AAC.1
MTAKQLALSHPVCASLLAGEGSCTADEAMALLDASVKDSCDPLCPDCGSTEEYEYDTGVTQLPAYADEATQQPASYLATTQPAYDASDSYQEQPSDVSHGSNDGDEYAAPQQTGASPEQEQTGCFGSLPMGLEQCVCDGATIGEAAGLAACSAVFAQCMDLIPFSVNDAAPPTEKTCDSLAQSTCVDTGMQLALAMQPCAELLFQDGVSSKCSPQKARQLFQAQMDNICSPLCPDCARL